MTADARYLCGSLASCGDLFCLSVFRFSFVSLTFYFDVVRYSGVTKVGVTRCGN